MIARTLLRCCTAPRSIGAFTHIIEPPLNTREVRRLGWVSLSNMLNICCNNPTHNYPHDCAYSPRALPGCAKYFSSINHSSSLSRLKYFAAEKVVSRSNVLNICCSHPTHYHPCDCAYSPRALPGSAKYLCSLRIQRATCSCCARTG